MDSQLLAVRRWWDREVRGETDEPARDLIAFPGQVAVALALGVVPGFFLAWVVGGELVTGATLLRSTLWSMGGAALFPVYLRRFRYKKPIRRLAEAGFLTGATFGALLFDFGLISLPAVILSGAIGALAPFSVHMYRSALLSSLIALLLVHAGLVHLWVVPLMALAPIALDYLIRVDDLVDERVRIPFSTWVRRKFRR